MAKPRASGPALATKGTQRVRGRPHAVGRGVGAKIEERRKAKTFLERWLQPGEESERT